MHTPPPGPSSSDRAPHQHAPAAPPARVPDPGSRGAATLAWILGIGFFLAVAALQTLGASSASTQTPPVEPADQPSDPLSGPDPASDPRPQSEPSPEPGPDPNPEPDPDPEPQSKAAQESDQPSGESAEPAESSKPAIPPPGADPFTMTSMMRVGVGENAGFGPAPLDAAADPVELVRAAVVEFHQQASPGDDPNANADPDASADRPASPDPFTIARQRFDQAADASGLSQATLDALRADLDTFALVMRTGPGAIPESRRDELLARHGWFARLALSHTLEESDSTRRATVTQGRTLAIALGGFVAAALGAFAVGVVLFIIALVKRSNRTLALRFDPPAPGGSVYLEIFTVFIGAFLLHMIISDVLRAIHTETGLWYGVIGQWALLLVVLWPLRRGVDWSRARRDLGLHRGRGFAREIGAGIVGYLAGLPILAAGYGLMFTLLFFQRTVTGETPAPNNPLIELAGSGDLLLIIALVTLATLWAPLVEEIVFRGAVYRHLRSRVGFLLAAIVTGIFFAFMHSYGPAFTPPLIALAITFAALREWRGSLIAPMVAHFIHNAALLAFVLTLSSLTS